MREFMKLLESRMDYQPSAKFQALEAKLAEIQSAGSQEGHAEITVLCRAIKKLYPNTNIVMECGQGSQSVSFKPPIEIEGGEYTIDAIINAVDSGEWRAAQGDVRAQTLLGHVEHIFAVIDMVSDVFNSDIDEVSV